MLRRLALFAFFLLSASLARADDAAIRRVALVIGNSAYQHAGVLTNPKNDAAAMARLFSKAGFASVETRFDLGVTELRHALADFELVSAGADVAVVYYSGHGIETDGHNYLVPIDAAIRRVVDVQDETVPLERVLDSVAGAHKLKLVILDACRADPFNATVQHRALHRGLARVEPSEADELIAYSAKAGTVADDGSPGGNSPFTGALLKRLTTPGLDVELALRQVRDDVLQATGRAQEPFYYGSMGGAQIPLAPAGAVKPVAEAQPADQPTPQGPPITLSGKAEDFGPLRTAQLDLWVSAQGRSYSPEVAAAFRRDFPAAKLNERQVPSGDFVTEVQTAAQSQKAPDIAFIDNFRELKPVLDAKLGVTAWGHASRFPINGWWVIFKDTRHLAEAQAFIRWLDRSPDWQPRAVNKYLSPEATREVEDKAVQAMRAYLANDESAMESLFDEEAARFRLFAAPSTPRVDDVQAILTFGNARLAFVLLAVVASGDDVYGMRHMILIFRNRGAGWRLLFFDPDARMPNAPGSDANPPLLHTFDSAIARGAPVVVPPPAVLIDPPDRAQSQRFPRPNIVWSTEAAAHDMFFVEAQFTNPGGEKIWSTSYLWPFAATGTSHVFTQPAPFGTGMQPHRWRVWTLDPSGAVTITSWRTILFTN